MLLKCLSLAAAQTRPPVEVIVADAGPHWERSRDRVLGELANKHPHIRWVYEKAAMLSCAGQRNQVADLATADVLFLIDDDSEMYPDCAEQIMRVYDADEQQVLVGVMPFLAARPPGSNSPAGEKARQPARGKGVGWRKRLNRWLDQLNARFRGNLLPPELRARPSAPLPKVTGATITPTDTMHGCRMTCRRAFVVRHRFDDRMQYLHDETEFSIRARQQGGVLALLHLPLIYHAAAKTGVAARKGRSYRARWMLGHAYMCRKLMGDAAAATAFCRRYLQRTMLSDLLIGVLQRDLARWRGSRDARRGIERLLAADLTHLPSVYTRCVEELV